MFREKPACTSPTHGNRSGQVGKWGSDILSQSAMSAIPPIATVIATCRAVAKCQKRTFRAAANSILFDHLVGAREQGLRTALAPDRFSDFWQD